MSVIAGQSIVIDCPAKGVPTPLISWFKDDREIKPSNSIDIRILYNGRRLEINSAKVSDAGRYKCRAQNDAGHADRRYDLFVFGQLLVLLVFYFINKLIKYDKVAFISCDVSTIYVVFT